MSETQLNRQTQLNRSSAPLYVQVREALRQRITLDALPPGTMLPTEEELQATFGVSRSVVRQALGDLADAGLVERRRGRGSVVSAPSEHRRRLQEAGGLQRQVLASGHSLHTRLLDLRAVEAPDDLRGALGSTDAWRLERLRSVDDAPSIFMRTWVPRDVAPGLTAGELGGGSLLALLRSLGHDPVGGHRQVQAVPAAAEVAQHLGIDAGTAVLLLTGETRDRGGRCLEWFHAWHSPQTVFDIDAVVAPNTPAAPAVSMIEGEERRRRTSARDERLLELVTQMRDLISES